MKYYDKNGNIGEIINNDDEIIDTSRIEQLQFIKRTNDEIKDEKEKINIYNI